MELHSQIEHTTELAVDALTSNITQGESDLSQPQSYSILGQTTTAPFLAALSSGFTRRGRRFRASQIPLPSIKKVTPLSTKCTMVRRMSKKG